MDERECVAEWWESLSDEQQEEACRVVRQREPEPSWMTKTLMDHGVTMTGAASEGFETAWPLPGVVAEFVLERCETDEG